MAKMIKKKLTIFKDYSVIRGYISDRKLIHKIEMSDLICQMLMFQLIGPFIM